MGITILVIGIFILMFIIFLVSLHEIEKHSKRQADALEEVVKLLEKHNKNEKHL